ncbi:MAG TPA: hypothetical protein PK777_12015 [Thermoguttaceae bacterium]|nr:hypothetical protein [Thermoguttaceae bacterium]HPP53669.1 hypothetical protein [Thermoguttaceae bacterium]
MDILNRLRFFYLAYLSYPASDRFLYRLAFRHPPSSILEIGLGGAVRAQRLLEIIRQRVPGDPVFYTGIDLFETTPPQFGKRIPLKEVYRTLRQTGAQIRLYPGDPWTVLSQRANYLGPVDLLLVSSQVDSKSMAKAWFYIPRMLRPDSQVFVEHRSGQKCFFRKINPASLQAWADSRKMSKAA